MYIGVFRQYIGRAWQTMKRRHYGHRNQFAKKISELGKHFNEHGAQNVNLQIIDQVNEGNHEGLKRKDGFWQHQLMTFIDQGGLNSKDDLDEEDFRR